MKKKKNKQQKKQKQEEKQLSKNVLSEYVQWDSNKRQFSLFPL